MPRVVWAEESKNGLRFEIEPSYDVVPTTPQCPSDGQSSCTHIVPKPGEIKKRLKVTIFF